MRGATVHGTLDAQHNADLCATGLRSLLIDPKFLDQLPESIRFDVAESQLVLPAACPSLHPESPRRLRDLDPVVQEKLEEAATREFHQQDARELYTTLLDKSSIPKLDQSWLRAHVAWYAHRQNDRSWRDALLLQLEAEQGGSAATSTALLAATVDKALPTWASETLRHLPYYEAVAFIARLQEREIDTGAFEEAFLETQTLRAHLKRIVPTIPSLLASEDIIYRKFDGALLLYHPSLDLRGSGQGAVIDVDSLQSLIARLRQSPAKGLPLVPWSGEVTFATDSPSPVVPGLVGITPHIAPTPFWSRGWSLGLVMLLLTSILVTGLSLTWRSIRQRAETTRVRAEFLTMVTHELKTPLAGIRLLSEMLEDGHVPDDAKREEYYSRLSSEAVRLSMLIENVLDLGRMERGERAYDFEPCDLAAVVNEAVTLFEPIAQRSGIRIHSELDRAPQTPADRAALLQAFLNVLDNARKYGCKSEGASLDVSGQVEGNHYIITFTDDGPGIPASEQASIFDRFERAQTHRDGNIPGVGLGLHLARTILRHHGGELDLAPTDPSAKTRGAAFRFTLPLRSVS